MVDFRECVLCKARSDSCAVTKPVLTSDKRFTNPWKLLRAITDYRFTRRPGGGVEPPTREHGVALAGPALFAIKHARVSRGIKHHFVAIVVGIHRVKDVARVDAHPLHVAGRTFERQKTDAWLIRAIPVVGQTGTALCGIQIKDTRQVKNQRVFFGDG